MRDMVGLFMAGVLDQPSTGTVRVENRTCARKKKLLQVVCNSASDDDSSARYPRFGFAWERIVSTVAYYSPGTRPL